MALRTPAMSISDQGLKLIKSFEKLCLAVYLDQAGKPTIGYGHLIVKGETFDGPITVARAEALLAVDVEAAEQLVRKLVLPKCPLAQYEFDALVAFVFNIGAEAFRASTLLAYLLVRNKEAAAAQLLRWVKVTVKKKKVKSAGLVRRRNAEHALFLGKPFEVFL